MSNALEIRNLSKKYSGFTLNNINLTLPSGCIMGFIGENGAGKSTTIKLILDLVSKDSGEISVLGSTLTRDNRELKEHIGVVLDEANFPENINAKDIEKIMSKCYRTWQSETFTNYLDKFKLPTNKAIKDFSKGMKMKLSIATALSHDSQLLILDEATSGLDPIIRDEILDVFLDFIQDENHSVFISSHIISDLEKICDYVTLIHEGSILFSEPKDNLLEDYVIIKCTSDDIKQLDSSAIVGVRTSRFSTEALVKKDKLKRSFVTDKPTLEDIMLYHIKNDNKLY